MIKYLRLIALNVWMMLMSFFVILISPFFWRKPILNWFFFKGFSIGVKHIFNINIVIRNEENIHRYTSCILMGNHQSGIDMGTFGAAYKKNLVMVGKKEVLYIPLLGIFFYIAGNILIDRANRTDSVSKLSATAAEIKKRSVSVGVFPEGTRNNTLEGFLKFKKGGFYLAIEAQVPIVPMVSNSLKEVANYKTGKVGNGTVIIQCLEPIQTTGMTIKDVDRLMAEVQDKMMKAYDALNRELGIQAEVRIVEKKKA